MLLLGAHISGVRRWCVHVPRVNEAQPPVVGPTPGTPDATPCVCCCLQKDLVSKSPLCSPPATASKSECAGCEPGISRCTVAVSTMFRVCHLTVPPRALFRKQINKCCITVYSFMSYIPNLQETRPESHRRGPGRWDERWLFEMSNLIFLSDFLSFFLMNGELLLTVHIVTGPHNKCPFIGTVTSKLQCSIKWHSWHTICAA